MIRIAVLLLAAGMLVAAEPALAGGTVYEGRGHMHRVLCEMDLDLPWLFHLHSHWVITGWKILGLVGATLFAGRWLYQAWHRKRTGSSEIPTSFWVLSLIGAVMTTMYFVWGKNDSVGFLQNFLPALVACYNLVQDLRPKTK